MDSKCFCNCEILLWHRLSIIEVHLLQYDLIHEPQCLQGWTCSSTATGPLRCACSGQGLAVTTGTSGCPSPPSWTYPLDTVPWTEFTEEFQLASTGTATVPWPPASPGVWPMLLSERSQAQQWGDKSMAQQWEQNTATNKHWTPTARQESPVASTGACWLIARLQWQL